MLMFASPQTGANASSSPYISFVIATIKAACPKNSGIIHFIIS